tara:strand:+ start:2819 stop:3232 length:414 start_codon:yes stop_codon:yes gene_type:complete
MIQVTFTSRRAKTIDSPNDIVPTVYQYANSKCPRGSNEYKILDAIIIEHYATHTLDELVKITGVYKWRVVYRIQFLMQNGYIQSKLQLHLTNEAKVDLTKSIRHNKNIIKNATKAINSASNKLSRCSNKTKTIKRAA